MKRLIILFAFMVIVASSLVAQTDNSAPVVWERYAVPARKVSFLFPKMPMVLESPSICGELASVTYLAYAEGSSMKSSSPARAKALLR